MTTEERDAVSQHVDRARALLDRVAHEDERGRAAVDLAAAREATERALRIVRGTQHVDDVVGVPA